MYMCIYFLHCILLHVLVTLVYWFCICDIYLENFQMQAKCKTVLSREKILLCSRRKFNSCISLSSEKTAGQTLSLDPPDHGSVPVQFGDYKTVFRNKELSELSRALLVLRICSFDWVVNNGEKLMSVSKRLFGNTIYSAVQRKTFYGQFIGGDSPEDVAVLVDKLKLDGIGPLLAVPMEDDAGGSKNVRVLEDMMDTNLRKTLSCLKMVSGLNCEIPMMQLKLTALLPGELCTKISKSCPNPSKDNKATVEGLSSFFYTNQMPTLQNLELTSDECAQFESGLRRLRTVLEEAKKNGIWMLIDAEYTYMNPALNLLTLAMMLNYNANSNIVGYTYQNYLKETSRLLKRDHDFIMANGVCFSGKLVRGAYLEKERMLASKYGYPCPVNDTYEETSKTYHDSFDFVLDSVIKNQHKCQFVVATHNEDTVRYAVTRMNECSLHKKNGSLLFAQVLGMGDQVSCALGNAGYLVYKSIPYGNIDETLPYLLRRLHENRSILNGIRREKELLSQAFKDKMKKKALGNFSS